MGFGDFISFVGAALSFVPGLQPIGFSLMVAGGFIAQGEAKAEAMRKAREAMQGLRANTQTTERPIPVIYGRQRVGGNCMWMSTEGMNPADYNPPRNKLFMIYGISEGPIDGFEEMFFGDVKVWDAKVGHVKGQFYNRFYHEFRLGTNSQAPFMHLADYHNLYEVASETFPCMAVALVELFSGDEYQQIPVVNWTIRGKTVPDWTDVNSPGVEKWSQSGVLQAADLLTHPRYGMGISSLKLILSDIRSSHAYVTENINPTSREITETVDQSGFRPRYWEKTVQLPRNTGVGYNEGYDPDPAGARYSFRLTERVPIRPGSVSFLSPYGSVWTDSPRSGIISEFGTVVPAGGGAVVGSISYFTGSVLMDKPAFPGYYDEGYAPVSETWKVKWYSDWGFSHNLKYRNIVRSAHVVCTPETLVETGTVTSSNEINLYSSQGGGGLLNYTTGELNAWFGAPEFYNNPPVEVHYRVGSRARFSTNYPLMEPTRIGDAMQELLQHFRGFPVYSEGKYGIRIDKPESGGVTDAAILDAASASAVNPMTYSIGAGSNRLLVVAVTQEFGTTMPAVSATYGGQAMTWLRGEEVGTTTFLKVDILYLDEAGIAAASGSSLSISGLTSTDFTIHARSYENVDQDSPIRQSNATESNAATPNPLTLTLSVEAGSIAVGMAACGNSDTCTWNADLTERTEQGGTGSHTGSFADLAYAAADAGVTVAATWVTQNRAIVVALEVSGDPLPGGTVLSFDDSNIVEGTFQFSQPSVKEIPSKVTIKYVDALNNYSPADASFDARSVAPGNEVEHNYIFPGVTARDEAMASAYTLANIGTTLRNAISFVAGYQARSLQAGDIIDVTHPSAAWSAKLFRVLSIAWAGHNQYQISAAEHDPSVYVDDWVEGPMRSMNPSFFPKQSFWPPNVSSATVQEVVRTGAGGETIPAIKFNIYAVDSPNLPVDRWKVFYSNEARGQALRPGYEGTNSVGYIPTEAPGLYSVSIYGASKFGNLSPKVWASSVYVQGAPEHDWQRMRFYATSPSYLYDAASLVWDDYSFLEVIAAPNATVAFYRRVWGGGNRDYYSARLDGTYVMSGANFNPQLVTSGFYATSVIGVCGCVCSGDIVAGFISGNKMLGGVTWDAVSGTQAQSWTFISSAFLGPVSVERNPITGQMIAIGQDGAGIGFKYCVISTNLAISTPGVALDSIFPWAYTRLSLSFSNSFMLVTGATHFTATRPLGGYGDPSKEKGFNVDLWMFTANSYTAVVSKSRIADLYNFVSADYPWGLNFQSRLIVGGKFMYTCEAWSYDDNVVRPGYIWGMADAFALNQLRMTPFNDPNVGSGDGYAYGRYQGRPVYVPAENKILLTILKYYPGSTGGFGFYRVPINAYDVGSYHPSALQTWVDIW